METEDFRTWLAQSLRIRSSALRTCFSDRIPTARELDDIVQLEALADDAVNVSEHVFLLFQKMLLIDDLARSFERVSYALIQQVGSRCVPRDATDLVRSLLLETLHEGRRQRSTASDLDHLFSARPTSDFARPHLGYRLRVS